MTCLNSGLGTNPKARHEPKSSARTQRQLWAERGSGNDKMKALDVQGGDHPWVSRGGVKLAHGLDRFGWDVSGVDGDRCRLVDRGVHRRPARRAARLTFFAVDSGTNQLAWKLRDDPPRHRPRTDQRAGADRGAYPGGRST